MSNHKKPVKELPEVTEEQLQIIQSIAKQFANGFKFGYIDADDIYQEACIEGVKGVTNWDGERPLDNFLFIHIKRRLINLRRDKYYRVETPCSSCPVRQHHGKLVFCNEQCEKVYRRWERNNRAKANLISPQDIAVTETDNLLLEDNVEDKIHMVEIEHMIREQLAPGVRRDYMRMKEGITLTKSRQLKVRQEVLEILKWQQQDAEI